MFYIIPMLTIYSKLLCCSKHFNSKFNKKFFYLKYYLNYKMKISSNIDKQTPFVASLLLTGANLFSKPLAFIREILFAYSFGITHITDFFFFAFNLSNSLIWSILKTYSGSFMPVFLDIKSKDNDSATEFLANSFLWIIIQSIILFVSTSFIIFLWQCHDKLISTNLALSIILLSVSYATLAGIGQFLTVICQSYYQFFYPVLFAFLFNIFTVGALLFFTKSFGINAFIFSQVIWAILQIIGLWIWIKKRIKKNIFKKLKLFNINQKRLLNLLLPTLIGTNLWPIHLFIATTAASWLASGAISAVNYSARFEYGTAGLVIFSIMSALFPTMISFASENKINEFKRTFSNGMNAIIYLMSPIVFSTIFFSYIIISITYRHGAFNNSAALITSQFLSYHILMLYTIGITGMSYQAFIALKKPWESFWSILAGIIFNIIFCALFVKPYGIFIVALGSIIGTLISSIWQLYILDKKGLFSLNRFLTKILIRGFIAFLCCLFFYCISHFLHLRGYFEIAYPLSSIAFYFILSFILKWEESKYFYNKVFKLTKKFTY
ncbi:MAG TPA: hypothetical protein ENO30_06345 [Thermodesulfobium narugense]|nr:hypothetical protein [Thermodesulfobium narugense]